MARKSKLKNPKTKIKPSGFVVIYSRGYSHLPDNIRATLGVSDKCKVPFISDANVVLLFRPDIDPDTLKKALEVLQKDIELRIHEKG